MVRPDVASVLASSLIKQGKFEKVKAALAYTLEEKKVSCNEMAIAVDSEKFPTVSTIKKYRGEGVAKIWLTNWIIQLCSFFSVSGGTQEHQLELAAELIIDEYYYFTTADLHMFSKKAIKGDFGKSYNRFDVPVLMDWLGQYREFRFDCAARISDQKKRQIEENEKSSPMPDFIKKLIPHHTEAEKMKKITFDEAMDIFKNQWSVEYEQSERKLSKKDFFALRYQNLIKK